MPDELVTDIWKACQNNLGAFQTIFGGNFVIVDNTVYKPINKTVQKAVDGFLRKPLYNRIGKKWVQTARALKNAKLIKAGREIIGKSLNEGRIQERFNLFFEENEPTNPDLWDRAIAAAKAKYDVYPSAYANAFASKWYGDKGGKWRTKKD